MADNSRGIHVSPGVYSKETEISYAVKSLGITTLGLVGETLKGPAFQPMMVENWQEFQEMFGGTSPEKFKGSQYPKYELPYIAKSYLSESNQLQVCRVLGLSGYNAGPAWAIKDNNGMVIAVLRSRGYYDETRQFSTEGNDNCECPQTVYDYLTYHVGEISVDGRDCNTPKSYNMGVLGLGKYRSLSQNGDACNSYTLDSNENGFGVNPLNYGRFTIKGNMGPQIKDATVDEKLDGYFEYAVSLNPHEKDYILKVLGTNPSDGTAPIYVESLYDVALKQGIEDNSIKAISETLEAYNVYRVSDYCKYEPVNNIMTKPESALTRKDVGKRFLADAGAVAAQFTFHLYDEATNLPVEQEAQSILIIDEYQLDENGEIAKDENGNDIVLVSHTEPVANNNSNIVVVGHIYTVVQYTDENGKRHYYYREYNGDKKEVLDSQTNVLVKNNADGRYYRLQNGKDGEDVGAVTCNMNHYMEQYRFASTPWFVSNIKGDAKHMELNRLFRFHTISDGDNANKEIKVSIQNIKTDDMTFDVVIRDINDTDEMPVVLERFSKCSMVPSDKGYIAYKIGSVDGTYESKSKFVTVEVNEDQTAYASVPAGFMGYPMTDFAGLQVKDDVDHSKMKKPTLKYNVNYDEDIKHRRQYFGLSSKVGVDVDYFTYKGYMAYGENVDYLGNGFHLDSRLSVNNYTSEKPEITVDGELGYTFDTVSVNTRTRILDNTPIIGTEAEMEGCIYEYVDLRKFTCYFYGGFDGWDIYRDARSNTDEFKMTKYKGEYNEVNGEGEAFNKIMAPDTLKLNQQGITSDFYAYLSGIRQFANPEEIDINVFATPGIDILNNKLLVEEAIDMIEEERADSIYVVTMPDKPFGASDYVDDMYTPDDVVYELDDTEIESNYACTYYPWVKYEDTVNHQFIYLPPTKDVVRNMAKTDNEAHPWFAPAGISRGNVDCVRAHYVTKLADEDVLYEGRVNPIKTFASDGVKIWGQKNLQKGDAMLTRIAVRRLLLRMRKLVSIACLGLIFEPNDSATRNSFLSLVTPIMDNMKANRAISDYRIMVNDTVESRERRELSCNIMFKPYNALEYIDLTFTVTPESVSFDSI